MADKILYRSGSLMVERIYRARLPRTRVTLDGVAFIPPSGIQERYFSALGDALALSRAEALDQAYEAVDVLRLGCTDEQEEILYQALRKIDELCETEEEQNG